MCVRPSPYLYNKNETGVTVTVYLCLPIDAI